MKTEPTTPEPRPPSPTGDAAVARRSTKRLPQIAPGASGARGFIAVALVTAFAVTALVAAFNMVVDPYGLLGTGLFVKGTFSDRTVKADLIEKLAAPPKVVVVGSSRSMRVSPTLIEDATGRTAFNAGVNGIGGAVDVWAFVNYLHDRWPEARFDYLWYVDVETFSNSEIGGRLTGEPRLLKYAGEGLTSRQHLSSAVAEVLSGVESVLAWTTVEDSIALLRQQDKASTREVRYRRTFLDDGYRLPHERTPKAARRAYAKGLQTSLGQYVPIYRDDFERLDPGARQYFEATIALMRELGGSPTLVLTPMHPDLYAELRPLGWEERRGWVVDYLRSAQAEYGFTFVDMHDTARFGADLKGFYDGVHMNDVNNDRLLRAVLRETGGEL